MEDRRGLCPWAATALVWLAGCAPSGAPPIAQRDAGATSDAAVEPSDAAVERSDAAASTAGAGSIPFNPTLLTEDASTPTSDCSVAASAFVYVLSDNNDLYRFAPDQKTFTQVGAVACAPGQTPNSMAVDRKATAWVNYLDGTLHPVSTVDASCSGSAITVPSGWAQDGMAYVASDAGSEVENLYLTGSYASAAAGLGVVNTATGTLTPIAQYTGTLHAASAELTGTGDGRLFGLFAVSPANLAQIERGTGTILSQTPLPGLALSSASSFAFSFWGGRFYFYTYPNPGSSSTNVAEYDPTTGSFNASFMTDIGFVIVGAGVSTCAPLVQPSPK
ncbi:MAG: hypothetical protein ABI548_17020 [Polyangiaceae bacterium]